MKKSSKVLLLVLTIMSIFMVMTISSSAYTSGDYEYRFVYNGNVEITGYTGFATSLEIPSTIDGYTVTSIGYEAFRGCTSLRSIEIPDSVTSIGDFAFDDCIGLQNMYYTGTADDWAKISFGYRSNPMIYAKNEYFNGELVTDVVLSEGVTSIVCTFYGCTSLQSITIPDSVTTIGFQAFFNCTSLQSITIPDSVTTIGNEAFYNCTSLQSITIGDGVTFIGDEAFYNCTSLQNMYYTGTADDWVKISFGGYRSNPMRYAENEYFNDELVTDVVLSEGITSINDYVFCGCNMESITIPDSVTSIGDSAFCECTSLQSITIPDSVISIDWSAFSDCTSLRSIEIPDSVTSIGNYAFEDCTSLQSIIIPDSVTSIGNYAFEECTSLQNIVIPNSVTSIGYAAFRDCTSLWHVLYTGTKGQWSEISIGDYNDKLTNATRHYKVSSNPITETITKAPTCIKNGSKTLRCSICDAEKKNVTAYKLGHDLHFTKTIATSCQKNGCDAYPCSRCDYVEERNCVEMLEHNFKNGVCTYCKGLKADCVSSPHNYPNNYDKTWVISKTNATKIKVTFSEKTYTEEYVDFIYIYDANNKLIGKYSGSQLAGACITVNSDKVKIRLASDNQENNYGFSVKKVEAIYPLTTFTLSTTKYTYNGKVKTPSVTVKDSKGNTLKKDVDYTVKYESGRTKPGKYTVTITFKGNYTGTKKLYFTIAPTVPKVTATQTTSSITLKWNKVVGADGYRVYKYNTKTKKYEKLKDVSGTSIKISKLKAGTAYKYKVNAYTKDDGVIWGTTSNEIATATKCKTPKITKLTTGNSKANIAWSNVSGESGYQVYYSTKKDSGYKKLGTYKANKVKTSKKLKKGKTYYFKVRAYKKTASGTVYSSWSSVKKIKIK